MVWVIDDDFILQLLYFIPSGMTLRLFEKEASGRENGGSSGVASICVYCKWRLKGWSPFSLVGLWISSLDWYK